MEFWSFGVLGVLAGFGAWGCWRAWCKNGIGKWSRPPRRTEDAYPTCVANATMIVVEVGRVVCVGWVGGGGRERGAASTMF